MRTLSTLAAAAALSIAACRSPVPVTAPATGAPSAAARIVLISYDGLSADEIQKRYSGETSPSAGFAGMFHQGLFVDRVIPVNPSLTAVAHVSMITGAEPKVTGVVSNSLRTETTPPGETVSGFAVPIQAETLWEAARRQGKTVGVITFPGADGTTERRKGDWGLVYSQPVTRSRVINLARNDFTPEWTPPGWTSTADGSTFSPALHARIPWTVTVAGKEIRQIIVLTALDTTDDAKENYDRIVVRNGEQEIALDDGWFPISKSVEESGSAYLYGSWSRIVSFDSALTHTVVYWGPIARNQGYPDSYRQMIDREVGFWPSAPDESEARRWLSGDGAIGPNLFVDQMRRFSSFFTRAAIVSAEQMPFDLLIAYQPIVDEAEHTFYLKNPRQKYFSDDNARSSAGVIDAAYQAVEDSVASLLRVLDPASTALIVTGDHGMGQIDTAVAVDRLLADWGFATIEGQRLSSGSRWMAATSGSVAHLYLSGTARPGEVADLVTRLKALRAPDGASVFESVEPAPVGANRNSGAIIAYSFPRFALTSAVTGDTFTKTEYFGQHGGLNSHPELHTILASFGRGVEPERVPSMRQTAIAAYVAHLMRIDPPADATASR